MLVVKSPVHVHLDITYSCNWNCQFCNLKHPSEMPPLERFQEILKKLKDAEVFELTFFGGEPFLHPNCFQIAEEAYKMGFEINFVSNGTLISKDNIHLIIHFFKNGSISLHGFEDTHDKLVGVKGAFKKVINSLNLLTENNFPVGVCITITAINVDEIPQLVTFLLENYSLFYIALDIFEPFQGHRMDLVPEYTKLKSILKEISEIRKSYSDVYIETGGGCPFCLFPDLEFAKKSCWAGTLEGAVDPYGNVKVCSASLYPVGNIFFSSLNEIWQNSPMIKWFRSLDWVTAPCNNCPILYECLGGCKVAGSEPFSIDILVKVWKDHLNESVQENLNPKISFSFYKEKKIKPNTKSVILDKIILDERVKWRKDLSGILVRNPYGDYYMLPEKVDMLLSQLKYPIEKSLIIKQFSNFKPEELENFLIKLYYLGIIKTFKEKEVNYDRKTNEKTKYSKCPKNF